MKNNWKICKYYIFRHAGFPFELMEKIKFKNTYRTIGKLLRRKNDESCIRWTKETFEEELYRKRLQLQEIASTEKFQEAVFLQNQNSYQNDAYECILKFSKQEIDRNIRKYDSRRKELLAYRYLQRFCTKNDTVSFFGPFYIGKFHDAKENIALKIDGRHKTKNNKVYISQWLIEAIVDKMFENDEIFKTLKPCLSPRIFVNGREIYDLITGTKIETELDKICSEILRLAGQSNDAAEISLNLGKNGVNKEEAFDKIRQLIKNHILLSGWETAANADDPAQYLISKLSNVSPGIDNEWLAKLERLARLKNRFEKENFAKRLCIIAELKELFMPLLTDPLLKNLKSGKGFFTEYCESNIERLELGKEMRRDLQYSISFILNLVSGRITTIDKIKYTLFNEWLNKNFKNGEVSIKDVFYRIAKDKDAKKHLFKLGNINFSDVIYDLPPYFLDTIDRRMKSRIIRFELKGLERQFEAHLNKTEGVFGTCCDIFISSSSANAINKGDYKIVFGESHAMRKPLSIYKWMVETPAGGSNLIREMKKVHKNIERFFSLGQFLTIPHDILDVPYDFPDIKEVEADVYSERKENRISLSDLKLTRNGNSISLTAGKEKTPILLVNPLSEIYSLFSIPQVNVKNRRTAKIKTHFPRLEIDKFVTQREQWVFLKNELFFSQESYNKKNLEMWIELEEWRKKEKVPKQFFLDTGTGIKPVYIDFENFFAIEVFISFVRKSKDKIGIAEMLPGPGDLWFKDSEGRYTSEFRLLLHRCAVKENS